MDIRTGELYEIREGDEIPDDVREHMVLVPAGEVPRLQAMTPEQRRAWWRDFKHEAEREAARIDAHRSAVRRARNERKRQRRARRGK